MLNVDVLVVGAGPAGSAAARVLAGAGLRVLLTDRHAFPRDKVCGDALIPDSLAALATLGLRDRVDGAAYVSRVIRIYAPDGDTLNCVASAPRCLGRRSTSCMVSGAIEAGAQFMPHLKALGALESDGVVQGARFEHVRTRERVAVHARSTILATGAAGDALKQFGVCEEPSPSAMAARLYVRVPQSVADDHDYLAIRTRQRSVQDTGGFSRAPGVCSTWESDTCATLACSRRSATCACSFSNSFARFLLRARSWRQARC